MTSWLRPLLSYASLSNSVLRATYATFETLGVFSQQRAAIAHELAVRAWAEEISARLDEDVCVWTSRGGRS